MKKSTKTITGKFYMDASFIKAELPFQILHLQAVKSFPLLE